MTRNSSPSAPLSRIWAVITDASVAAVAIHYDAPWQRARASTAAGAAKRDAGAAIG